MTKELSPLPFEVLDTLKMIGNNVKIARIRRRMLQDELAKKCGISRKTLWRLEQGESGASTASLFTVLWALGLLDSAKGIASPDNDEHGKILEAARQHKRIREPNSLDNDF
jgi:transcriptional regulator with XRE-family HTH domain